MSYVNGFVLAVPKANRAAFVHHSEVADSWFTDQGALRVVECWEVDVPDGKLTDFRRAVQATADEAVVFSWIEWPDKATHDAAMAKMMNGQNDDPRIDFATNAPPFDGKRMIFGGFEAVVDTNGG